MIRVRMIEPEQFTAELGRAALGLAVIRRPHEKPAARTLVRRIRQRLDVADPIVASHQRTTAFVREGLFTVTADRLVHGGGDRQAALSPHCCPPSRSARSST